MRLGTILSTSVAFAVLFVAPFFATPADALTIYGDPVMAIDGDGDSNVSVYLETSVSSGDTSTYTFGYFLNYGSSFTVLGPDPTLSTFQGGDEIDFAVYDGSDYYTLSGDLADGSYEAVMEFSNLVTDGAPEQPTSGWSSYPDYYYDLSVSWSLPDTLQTASMTLNFSGGNDGIAPAHPFDEVNGNNLHSVPEPGTLVLLGAGMLGLGYFARKRSELLG